MEDIHENNKLKEDFSSTMELGRDHEMTPSEVGTEDHKLEDVLEKENLGLESSWSRESPKVLILYHKRNLTECKISSFGDLKQRVLVSKGTMIARKIEG